MPEYEEIRDEAWWSARQAAYLQRPEIQEEIAQRQAGIASRDEQVRAEEERLEAALAADCPGAQEAINQHYNLDALITDPPIPSAKDDPAEWRAYFLEFDGRDLPIRAQYEAERHSINAGAPADVGGLAAEYYERYCPSVSAEELAAEDRGMTLEELRAEREWPDPDAQ
jgi:hypothetical protein